jgi:hypothetical protein
VNYLTDGVGAFEVGLSQDRGQSPRRLPSEPTDNARHRAFSFSSATPRIVRLRPAATPSNPQRLQRIALERCEQRGPRWSPPNWGRAMICRSSRFPGGRRDLLTSTKGPCWRAGLALKPAGPHFSPSPFASTDKEPNVTEDDHLPRLRARFARVSRCDWKPARVCRG